MAWFGLQPKTDMKHEITFIEKPKPTEEGYLPYRVSQADINEDGSKYRWLQAQCSCGWKDSGDWKGRPFLSQKNGQPRSNHRRSAWQHYAIATDSAKAKDAPMELVGTIEKKRVTNEIWIVSSQGEKPDGWAPWRDGTETAYPWFTIEKNSQGWKTRYGPFSNREMAYVAGLDAMEKAYMKGHDITIASELDVDTVEVPIAAIDAYFTNLTKEAKEAQGVSALVKLREKLYKAQAAAELIDQAIETVESRIIEV